MQNKNKVGTTSDEVSKYRKNNWKAKALSRQVIISRQSDRIMELTASRDLWKTKYRSLKSSKTSEGFLTGTKAKKHQFGLVLVLLVIRWQSYGRMSLRCCRHCLCEMVVVMGLNLRVPSHVTIRWWACKSGYAAIKKCPLLPEPYVIYIDESIVIGGEKLLLVLGVQESCIDYKSGLDFSKMEVLSVSSSGSWKGDSIANILQQISQKYTLSYVVSDNGTNLRSACCRLGCIQISDWTHSLANILKGLYNGNEDFEGFSKSANTLRKQWFLSKEKSAYLPPTQRGKIRFANIFTVVNWGAKWLEKWSQIPENIQQDLAFLQQYSPLINELKSLEKTIEGLSKILKNNGYSLKNKDKLGVVLAEEKHTVFSQQVSRYLDRLEEKRAILNKENILCCSDIIESFFGKFKMKLDNNSPKKMTEFIYTMANFGKEFTQDEIKKALESVKISDLKAAKIKQK